MTPTRIALTFPGLARRAGCSVRCMPVFLYTCSVVALILGTSIAFGAKSAPALFAGLTLVICAVVMFCSAAIVGAIAGAVDALRRPGVQPARPVQPAQPQGHFPLS
jgi:hypothetical protein